MRTKLLAAGVSFLAAAVVAGVLFSGCASMPMEEKAYIGASVADMATTAYALDHGFHEGNPVLGGGSNAEVLAKSLAMNAALYYLQKWLIRNDSPEGKRHWWRITLCIRVVPVGWNVGQLVKGP